MRDIAVDRRSACRVRQDAHALPSTTQLRALDIHTLSTPRAAAGSAGRSSGEGGYIAAEPPGAALARGSPLVEVGLPAS